MFSAFKDNGEKKFYDQINEINIDGITYYKDSQLGIGGKGIVFLFKNREQGIINFITDKPSQIAVQFFIRDNSESIQSEFDSWKKLNYDVHHLIIDQKEILVMPYLGKANMMDYLKAFIITHNDPDLVINEILKALLAMTQALIKIYKNNFIHPDAFMDNLLYDGSKAHYIDFSKMISSDNAGKKFKKDIYDSFSDLETLRTFATLQTSDNFSTLENLYNDIISIANGCPNYSEKGAYLSAIQGDIEQAIKLHNQKKNINSIFFSQKNVNLNTNNNSENNNNCLIM